MQNKNLLAAILNVRKATSTVAKKGRNTFHNYNYATANDVINEVRDHMNEAGIVTIPKEVRDVTWHKDGAVEEGTVIFTVAHVQSGESMDVSVRASGEDKGDKKAYKLNTGALKYLLIQLFLLPTDDDPENDSKENGKRQAAPPAPVNKNNQTATPPPTGKPAANGKDQAPASEREWLNENTEAWKKAEEYIAGGGDMKKILTKYKVSKASQEKLMKKAPVKS